MRLVRQTALALMALSLSAQAVAEAPMVLAGGTPVLLKNSFQLTPREVKPGDRFEFKLADHLKVNGVVIVPAGTVGVGEIVSARRDGPFGRPGRIETKPLFIDYGGQRIELAGPLPPPRLTRAERKRLREERARQRRANGEEHVTHIHTPDAASAAIAGLAVVAATIVVTAMIRGPKGTLEADAPLPGVVRRNTVVAPAGSTLPAMTAVAATPQPRAPLPPQPRREPSGPAVVLTSI